MKKTSALASTLHVHPAAVSPLPFGASSLSGTSNQACCPGTADEGVGGLLGSPALPLDPQALSILYHCPIGCHWPSSFPQGLLRGLNPGPGGCKAGVDVWSLGDSLSALEAFGSMPATWDITVPSSL